MSKKKDKERDSEWYDKIYKEAREKGSSEYAKSPEATTYYPVWKKALAMIPHGARIAEFGCGPGQMAKMALDAGLKYVLGVDFSEEAIETARAINPGNEKLFQVADLYDPETFKMAKYDIAVLCEVVEHIEKDLEVLKSIPVGKQVLMTVPTFNFPGHLRYFETVKDAVSRYCRNEKVIKSDYSKLVCMNNPKRAGIIIIRGTRI